MEASPSCQQPDRIVQSTSEQSSSKQELEQVVLVETAYWKILTPQDEYLPKNNTCQAYHSWINIRSER